MNFKINKTAAAVKEQTGGGNYLSKTGIYPVTIKIASVEQNEHQAHAINFNVDYNGNPTTIYGMKLENNDGSRNYGADIFNKLCVIADLDDLTPAEVETHKLGKDGKEVDLSVLPDFTDFEVAIRVHEEYSKWNGKISKRLSIKNFYRAEDGASASEIVNDKDFGEQLKKDKEYMKTAKPTYRDCTPEEVEAYFAAQAGAKDSAPKAEVKAAPAKNLFD